MGEPLKKEESNVIRLSVVKGEKKQKEIHLKSDGSQDLRYGKKEPKKCASTKVYFLARDEIELVKKTLLAEIEEASYEVNRLTKKRDYALFCCGINIGLRASDVSTLTWGMVFDKDWEFNEFVSFEPQKTKHKNKYVTIAFNDSFKAAILDYKKAYEAVYGKAKRDNYVFFSKKGGHITTSRVWGVMKEAAEKAGIKKNIGSHSIRKTFARNFFAEAEDRGYALTMLQEWLGHNSSWDTLKYIGFTLEEQIKFVNSVNL